jgi:hypothetical protein
MMMSLVVTKIGIYRLGNDIKIGVIPRHEESLKVLFMINFIIFRSFGDASYVSMTAAPMMMSMVGTRDLRRYNLTVELLNKYLTLLVKIIPILNLRRCFSAIAIGISMTPRNFVNGNRLALLFDQ